MTRQRERLACAGRQQTNVSVATGEPTTLPADNNPTMFVNSLMQATVRAVTQPYDVTKSALRTCGLPVNHTDDIPSNVATDNSNPIVLVHGYMDNGKTPWWNIVNSYLRTAGWESDQIYNVSVGEIPLTTVGSPTETSEEVRYAIHAAHNEHDSQVDVIGHSMGGLAARYCVEETDVGQYVDNLITIGAPHQSTTLAYFGLSTSGAQAMRPGSDFLTTLNGSPLNPTVQYTAIWSPADVLLNPVSSGKLPDDLITDDDQNKNIRVGPYGHLELLHHPDVFETVLGELAV